MYQYQLHFRSSSANADVLSRLPLYKTSQNTPLPAELVLLMETIQDMPVSVDQIKTWTRKDPTLSRVMDQILSGWSDGVSDSLTLEMRSWIFQTLCHRDACWYSIFGRCSNLAIQAFAVIFWPFQWITTPCFTFLMLVKNIWNLAAGCRAPYTRKALPIYSQSWSNGPSTLSMAPLSKEVSGEYVRFHDHKLTFSNLAEPS